MADGVQMLLALHVQLLPDFQGAVVLGPDQEARNTAGTLLAAEGIEPMSVFW
jgi:hypothetical protein